MATGTIKAMQTISGGITGGYSSHANLVIKQYGNVVQIGGYITDVTAGSNVNLGTITGVKMPVNVVRSCAMVSGAAYDHPQDIAYLSMGTDGKLTLNSNLSGTKAVYFNFCYVAN